MIDRGKNTPMCVGSVAWSQPCQEAGGREPGGRRDHATLPTDIVDRFKFCDTAAAVPLSLPPPPPLPICPSFPPICSGRTR